MKKILLLATLILPNVILITAEAADTSIAVSVFKWTTLEATKYSFRTFMVNGYSAQFEPGNSSPLPTASNIKPVFLSAETVTPVISECLNLARLLPRGLSKPTATSGYLALQINGLGYVDANGIHFNDVESCSLFQR